MDKMWIKLTKLKALKQSHFAQDLHPNYTPKQAISKALHDIKEQFKKNINHTKC